MQVSEPAPCGTSQGVAWSQMQNSLGASGWARSGARQRSINCAWLDLLRVLQRCVWQGTLGHARGTQAVPRWSQEWRHPGVKRAVSQGEGFTWGSRPGGIMSSSSVERGCCNQPHRMPQP